ncbi:hypothetical protein GGG17_02870 [Arsenicicoccus sp. MKL-02]|uniref:Uncharacterized protein n=1 Tax=Arsenicicoccus cauae TaxID=2663847 RepID=A0A6I3ILU9_9MICO|nr:hypothetical protein [Arsenicicoccus cauae]MTB70930.1 hypothetical protein [Arsenicicoccus cauae]
MPQTSLDVICSLFQAASIREAASAAALSSRTTLDDLGAAVRGYYRTSQNLSFDPDAYYSGGWTASYWQWRHGDYQHWLDPLIYYPTVVFHDPLAEYFFDEHHKFLTFSDISIPQPKSGGIGAISPIEENTIVASQNFGSHRNDLETYRQNVAWRLESLADIEELVRTGVVRLISEYHTLAGAQNRIFTAIRHDLKRPDLLEWLQDYSSDANRQLTVRNNLRGMEITAPGVRLSDASTLLMFQPHFYYLHKVVTLTLHAGAKYVPDNPTDWDFFTLSATVSKTHAPLDRSLLRSITSLDLPRLPLTPETALDIRRNYDEFEAWRAEIRNVKRLCAATASESEVREAVQDAFSEKARSIRRRADTGLLGRLTADAAIAFGTEFAFWHFTGQAGAGLVSGPILLIHQMLSHDSNPGVLGVLTQNPRRHWQKQPAQP